MLGAIKNVLRAVMPLFVQKIVVYLRSHWQILAVMGVVLLGALPILGYPMGRDQGMYANIGKSILQGGTPFISMWDIKPPPIYYIYALGMAVFGQTPVGIRAIDFVVVPLAMLGLYVIGNLYQQRRVGVWGALIFAVFYFSDQFANLTQNDSIVTLPMIWAVVCAVSLQATPNSRQALLGAFLTGAWCGLTLWFKHYQAFFVGALVLHHVWQRWQPRAIFSKAIIYEAVAFCGGGLLIGGGLWLYFIATGMFDEMLIVAQGTSAYNAQYGDWGAFLGQMGNYFGFRWAYWGVVFALSGAWTILVIWRVLQRQSQKSGTTLICLWFLAGLAFMFIQRLGFDTHWIPMLPPMALMAGVVLDEFFLFLQHAPRKNIANAFATLVLVGFVGILAYNTWRPALPYLTGAETQEQYFARFQANDLKPSQSLQVVDYLRDKLPIGESLYTWGFRPEVAFMGGWQPATRYQAQFPLVATWYPHAWQQDNVDQLWAAMPQYVLILQDDFMPWVTGQNTDSHTILQTYTELNNWLMANYERTDTLGDFIVWHRKPTP
jgi:4-amino-4-deoxy-L-arabinose transferase-like glycosyltransferase